MRKLLHWSLVNPRWVVVGLALALVSCAPRDGGAPTGELAERPDVVLIVLDTFRPDHLGFNGYNRSTAPFLEALMERSAVFTRAFSTSSWTAPATSSLFTGLYPMRHGVTEGFLAHRRRSAALEDLIGEKMSLNRLPEDVETLAELLQNYGYATFGVATNINIGHEIGFDRGFGRFAKMIETPAVDVVSKISEWREQMLSARPYFLYLHFNDVHKPYETRAPWYLEGDGDEAGVAAYNSEIGYLDSVIAKLFDDYGWDRETLLVVVSDHGEEFGEHGQYGHRFSLYDELVRVLFVISGNDVGIPAGVIRTPVSLIDVMPTIVELVGVEPPDGRDGHSVAELLVGRSLLDSSSAVSTSTGNARALQRRTLFAHRMNRRPREAREDHLWTAIRMPWKLVMPPQGHPRLYHLGEDPEELTDVSEEHVDVAAGLAAELLAFQSTARRQGENIEVEIDEDTLKTLESLGYVE